MNKFIIYKILAVIISIIAVLIIFNIKVPLFEKIANTVNDSKFKIRKFIGVEHKPDKRVVIVDIDEESINRIGRWPWDRKKIAELIEKLNMAGVVGLDIVFSEPSNRESDNILAETIMNNNNVILGYFFRDTATEDIDGENFEKIAEFSIFRVKMESKSTHIREFNYIESNIPEINESALASAFFSIEPDVDGLYRNYPLGYLYKGVLLPPMGIQLLRFYLNKDIEVILNEKGFKEFRLGNILLKDRNYLRLNYYDNVEYVSAYSILSGKVKPEYFKDKIVIVGITEVGVFDLRPTPIDPVTPGVSLHYTLVSNILKSDYLSDKKLLDIVIIVILPFIALGIAFVKRIYIRVFLYIIVASIVIALSNFLFAFKYIWLSEFYHLTSLFLSAIILEAILFLITDQKSAMIKKAFSTYVSPEVVEIMLKDPDKLKLGGENREITVIFTDIRGFTTLSEKLKSEEVVYMLNQLNTPLTNIIIENGGMLDKYIGDAIMAIFNAPVDIDRHPDRACRSALAMYQTVEKLSEKFQSEGLPPVKIGIGVNTGEATVGNIGSDVRFDYTAIGDCVNLSSRLESLNKYYKTHIIVSETTKSKLSEPFLMRQIDKVVVKGKTEPVGIYELLQDNEKNKAMVKDFEIAYGEYLSGNFEVAKEKFKNLLEIYSDGLSEVYLKRCEELMKSDIDKSSWNGVYIAKEK
ncbi:MAG: adenylate/guanylate cyclase domain-containing protein [Calditerrivibrio sp.]|nr:adenylate/guanylate cyclase domain-containing protein [Calditerrivibrio sp.]